MSDQRPAIVFDIDGTLTDTNYLHAIAWRRANATAELEANGFRLTLPEVLALARRQDRRLRAAAD